MLALYFGTDPLLDRGAIWRRVAERRHPLWAVRSGPGDGNASAAAGRRASFARRWWGRRMARFVGHV